MKRMIVICSYEVALAETKGLIDMQMNLGVEEKILPLVAALRMFGVRTLMSCEGHDADHQTPYVQVEFDDSPLVLQILSYFNRHDRPDRGEHLYWTISPMPFGLSIGPMASFRPLTQLQAEALEFAEVLKRYAEVQGVAN